MKAATRLAGVLAAATMLVISFVVCLSPSVSGRNEFVWTTNSDNTITITKYTGSGTVVTIPGRINGLVVTMIGNEAFLGNWYLSDVTIPDSVTTIGDLAFLHCHALTNVTIPNGVIRIGNVTFSLSGLTTVTIPASVTSIGYDAFACCFNLTNVIVGSSVTNMEGSAFSNCDNLTDVFFRGNAPTCTDDVFFNNDKATIYYIPGTTGWGKEFGGRPTAVWRPEGGATTNGAAGAGARP